MATLTMPQLGESVTEGTILRWLIEPGGAIALDDPIVEVETEKVTVEIPSPFAGTLTTVLVQEGETVPVGAPLAEIDAIGEAPATAAAARPSAPPPPPPSSPPREEPPPLPATAPLPTGAQALSPQPQSVAGPGSTPSFSQRRYSPAVTRLATEHGIDPATVAGSGAGGRVTRKDVLAAVAARAARTTVAARAAQTTVAARAAQTTVAARAAQSTDAARAAQTTVAARAAQPTVAQRASPTPTPEPSPAAPAPAPADTVGGDIPSGDTIISLSPTRRRIAQHMLESKRSAPHAWLLVECDASALVARRAADRDAFKARHGLDLTYLPYIARAVCRALREFPALNATWPHDQLVQRGSVNLGIAVDAPEGLIVPAVKDADQLTVGGLARAMADLSARARTRKLTLDEVRGGTFTLDNTGVLGTTATAPIINTPQVAILTTEAITKRPVVVDGDAIAVRPMLNLCLSFDHRAMDGSTAALFTTRVRDLLQALDDDSAAE